MGTFSGQIDRALAAEYGREAVVIGEKGYYTLPSGRRVDLKPLLDHAVKGTRSYPPNIHLGDTHRGQYDTTIEVTNETTLSAAGRQIAMGFRPVALNFASATSPGGGFLTGARAQEEYLARSTGLYECIRGNPMYEFHRNHYSPLYSDYVIYSPDVPVIRADDGALLDEPYTLGIITAAAVNTVRVSKSELGQVLPAMWSRILKVLAVGIEHEHDAIVLGAWGCGAFGNSAPEIARLFHQALTENFDGAYRHVVFAVVDWSPNKRFIGPFESAFFGDS